MRRFSIVSLMCMVAIVAVCITALRSAGDLWSGIMLLVTAILIGTGIIGSLIGTGKVRHGWLGFTIFAGGYLLLIFLNADTGRLMVTTQALDYVNQQVSIGDPTLQLADRRAAFEEALDQMESDASILRAMKAPPTTLQTPSEVPDEVRLLKQGISNLDAQIDAYRKSAGVPKLGWNTLFPGATNHDSFVRIGHCIFALLAGILGAVVARRF